MNDTEPSVNGTAPQASPHLAPVPSDGQLSALLQRLEQSERDRDRMARQLSDLIGIKSGQVPPHMVPDVARSAVGEIGRMTGRELAASLDGRGAKFPPSWPSLADELSVPPRIMPHRVGGLAGWKHNVLVAGSRKVGKTTLMVNLAAAFSKSQAEIPWDDYYRMAAGWIPPAGADLDTWSPAVEPPPWHGPVPSTRRRPGRFLGLLDATMDGNVAYVNFEMDPDDLRDEFRRLPRDYYDPARIRLLHLRGEELAFIASPAGREKYVRWLRANHVDVMIADTWGALGAKNGVRNFNDDAEARRITDGLDAIKEAAGVSSMFLLIHTPHQNGERHLERFKGAGAVGDWADALWTYVADEEGGPRYLSALGRSRIDFAQAEIGFDPATGGLWHVGGSRRQAEAHKRRDATGQKVIDFVREHPGAGAAEIVNCGGNKGANARALDIAVVRGFVRVVPQGKNKKAHYLPDDLPQLPQEQAGKLGEPGEADPPQALWGS